MQAVVLFVTAILFILFGARGAMELYDSNIQKDMDAANYKVLRSISVLLLGFYVAAIGFALAQVIPK